MASHFQSRELYDFLFSFEAGINQGIDPDLLEKNQLANAINATVRGTLITGRSKYRKINLSYSNASVQTLVEDQLFQGAGYYKADFGTGAILASISGRLFQFVPDTVNNAVVTDVSILGDTNPPGIAQVFLWQAERWAIIQDGISTPIFFDGASSRRALTNAVIATVAAPGATIPGSGGSNSVPLTAVYAGSYNNQVNVFNGATLLGKFQIAQAAGTFFASLKNLGVTAGQTEASGSAISIINNYTGTTTSGAFINASGFTGDTGTINVTPNFLCPIGTSIKIQIGSVQAGFTVKAINGSAITIKNNSSTTGYNIGSGESVFLKTPGVNVLVANLAANFVAPAVGSSATATLDRQYTGADGQQVGINGFAYQISQQAVVPSNSVFLINPSASAIVIPAGATINSIPELPTGTIGVYGMGRNWICLPDGRTFVASDIVGGSSGTQANDYRDAVLQITENTYLSGGGSFVVPGNIGSIRAMRFAATLDASLGQGALQVFTQDVSFSCNAPVDRSTWQNITNPILTESLITNGSESQDSTINVNGDLMFRSSDGIRSLVLGRREFSTPGNVPQSREVQPTLDEDDPSLLNFCSAVSFDNRYLMTCGATQHDRGVYHPNLIAENFDPISTLRGKAPPVYDGVWSDLNAFKVLSGKFFGVERAFAFCLNVTTSKIELWEVLPSNTTISETKAKTWVKESPTLSFGQMFNKEKDFKRLINGEIYVDQIVGDIQFNAFYKPNQWPNWVPWNSWTIHADPTTDPGYRPRQGLGEPSPNDVDNVNGTPLREAFDFQFKLEVVGLTPDSGCRFRGARFKVNTIPQPEFATPAQ